jgi:DNA-binding response OmpR family regulator
LFRKYVARGKIAWNEGRESTIKPKILVIDDEASILHAVQIFLQQEGYQVEATDRYNKMLDKVADKDLPDLIILDILLADEDGRAVAKKLKSDPRTKHIPIILISAHPTAIKTSKWSGADAFITKPFEVDTLLNSITQFYPAA